MSSTGLSYFNWPEHFSFSLLIKKKNLLRIKLLTRANTKLNCTLYSVLFQVITVTFARRGQLVVSHLVLTKSNCSGTPLFRPALPASKSDQPYRPQNHTSLTSLKITPALPPSKSRQPYHPQNLTSLTILKVRPALPSSKSDQSYHPQNQACLTTLKIKPALPP